MLITYLNIFFTSSVIARFISSTFLFIALSNHPIGHYKFLSWIVCANDEVIIVNNTDSTLSLKGTILFGSHGEINENADANTKSIQTTIMSIDKGTVIVAYVGKIPVNSLHVPDSIILKIMSGAILQIQNGETLTINGSIEAGLYQVFDTTGVIKLRNNHAYPEWFGAKGDGSTNCKTAIQYAVNASPFVEFQKGTYIIDNQIVLPKYSNLGGQGIDNTIIKMTTNVGVIHTIQITDSVYIHDFTFKGTGAIMAPTTKNIVTAFGCGAGGGMGATFERVSIKDVQGCGIIAGSSPGILTRHNQYDKWNVTIKDCSFENLSNEAVLIPSYSKVENCTFKDIYFYGVDINGNYNVVKNNTFYNVGHKDNITEAATAILIYAAGGNPDSNFCNSASYNVIDGNNIQGGSAGGIYIQMAQTSFANSIYNPKANYNKIINNTIDSSVTGIYWQNISSNIGSITIGCGYPSVNPLIGNQIIGNNIRHSLAPAIIVMNSLGTDISLNRIDSCKSFSIYALKLGDENGNNSKPNKNLSIESNIVSNHFKAGIVVDSAINVKVIGNTIQEGRDTLAGSSRVGIWLLRDSLFNVSNNVIESSEILVDSTCHYGNITNNTVTH